MASVARKGYDLAVGGRQICWPRRICRNVVRTEASLLRIDQCCLGSEKDGMVKLRPGKSGGLVSTVGFESSVLIPVFFGSEDGCWR